MNEKIPLVIGRAYGRLTVLRRDGYIESRLSSGKVHKIIAVIAKCDCGDERRVSWSYVRRSYTGPCRHQAVADVGDVVGALVIIGEADREGARQHRRVTVNCICGNERVIAVRNLSRHVGAGCTCRHPRRIGDAKKALAKEAT